MGSLTLVQALADATTPLNLDTINSGAAPDDWALWTTDFATPAQRKNGGGSTMSAAFVGAATQSSATDARTISWTNGTPTASGSSALCVFNSSFASGNGFALTLPASTSPRRAWILVSPYNTPVHNLNISLTDGSASPIATTIQGAGGTFNPFTIIIDYQADTTTTLVVSFSEQAGAPQTVCLQAAAWATSGPVASLEQEGFRWRNDDGSQTTATWAAAQDSNLTSPAGTRVRLRTLLNATNDPASTQYQLEYKLSSASVYRAVKVLASANVTFGAAGTGSNGTTNCTPSYPTGISADTSELYLCVTGRSTTDVSPAVTGGGWTIVANFQGGDGAAYTVADVGDRRVTIFKKDTVTGSETGTITVTLAGNVTNNTLRSTIIRVEKPAGGWTTTELASTGADSTSGTGVAITGSTAIDWVANDLLLIVEAQSNDAATQGTVTLAATGVTFGTRTNRASNAVTNGFDHRHIIDTVNVTMGGVTVAPSYSYTASAATVAALAFLRIRALEPPIQMSASANITASGEATTAQLTAPSGKSTSDFVAGRMQDDENPADAVDITSDDYTEIEWSIVPASGRVTNGEVYQFRVTSNGTAFSTYTVTPQLTIGSGGSDTNASPTGVSATGSAGSVTINGGASKTLTGVSATGSAGTVTQTHSGSISLSGASATGSAGELAPPVNYTINIDGASAVGSAGTLTASLGQIASPTGVSATGSAGTLTQTHSGSLTLTGVSAAGNVGTLTTQAAGNASANLTGVSATGSAGSVALTYSASISLQGVSGTGGAGSVGQTVGASAPLTGIGATGLVGTLSVSGSGNVNVSLTGVQAVGGVGSLTESAAASASLIGVSGASAVGSLATSVANSAQLTGVSATGQVGTLNAFASSASLTLAGVAALGAVGTLTIQRSASLTLDGVSGIGSPGSPYVILKDTSFAPAIRTMRVQALTVRTLKVTASSRTLRVRGD